MRMIARPVGALCVALALDACAAGAPLGDPSPARTLAVSAATGVLGPARLACVVDGAPMVVDHVVGQLPELRQARQAIARQQLQAHARSVQQSMAAADRSAAAAAESTRLADAAIAAHERGDDLLGASLNAYASQVAAVSVVAGADPTLLVAGAPVDRVHGLDDDELGFLVRYARLRADVAAGRTPVPDERAARFATWDRDRPAVMDAYAEIVLRMYEDPYLPCPGR